MRTATEIHDSLSNHLAKLPKVDHAPALHTSVEIAPEDLETIIRSGHFVLISRGFAEELRVALLSQITRST